MRRLRLAGTLAVAALGVPATMVAGVPAQAATVCTPSTAAPAVSIDQTTLKLGEVISFHGTGWCHPTDGGSTVGVKLDAGDYSRPDTSVSSNKSVWVIVQADPDTGDFSGHFTLPDGTAAASTPAFADGNHTLTFLSGSLKAGDIIRSATAAFVVGIGSADGGATPKGPCTPTTATAQVHLGSTTAELGGLVHVTGSGFCNPAGGGSVIGVKLDDGDYALPTGSTTWTTIHADDSNGTFSTDVRLPDGTTATSTPAFRRGGHTLRFLTGSLAPGDMVRTLKSATFSIGAYAPSGLPDPLAATDLRASTRHGTAIALKKQKVVVRLPQTPAGTWVLATLYDADGSPSYPWETWRQLPASHQLTLARKPIAATGASGRVKLAVQSGDDGHVGDLLGWARLKLPAAAADAGTDAGTAGTDATSAPGAAVPTGTPGTNASPAGAADVPATPRQPFASYTKLDPHQHGSVRARSDAGVVTLTVGKAKPGALVYVDVYTPTTVLPAGWATVASDRTVKLDLTSLEGYAGATVQSADGTLLGWAPLALGDAGATDASADSTVAAEPVAAIAPAALAAANGPSSSDDGWLTGTDGLLLAAGAVLLAGASLVPARRRRTPGGVA